MLVIALSVLAMTSTGCTKEQVDSLVKTTKQIEFTTGASNENPATQPSDRAALEVGRATLTAVGTIYPPAYPFIVAAGLIAGVVGRAFGRDKTAKRFSQYIDELVEDSAASYEPTVPFTPALQKLLVERGHAKFALPEPEFIGEIQPATNASETRVTFD